MTPTGLRSRMSLPYLLAIAKGKTPTQIRWPSRERRLHPPERAEAAEATPDALSAPITLERRRRS